MEGSLPAVLTQHRLLGLWHHRSEPAFFSLCLVSTVHPHGVCMCKALQKRLHISIYRLKWSTHPSPLAFLLIKNVVLLYVYYGICTVHAMWFYAQLDKEPRLTSKKCQAYLQTQGTTVSARTIRCHLNEKGRYGRRPKRTLVLLFLWRVGELESSEMASN